MLETNEPVEKVNTEEKLTLRKNAWKIVKDSVHDVTLLKGLFVIDNVVKPYDAIIKTLKIYKYN